MLQADSERYRRYYQRIVLVIGLATMPLGLFITIYAPEITHVILSAKWVDATVYLQIFGIVAFLKPVLDTSTVVMLTYGLSRRLLVLSVVYNLLLAGFTFAGLAWGPVGVALANVVAIAGLMLPMLYYSLRRTPIGGVTFFGAVSTPAIASTAMAAVLLSVHGFTSQFGMTISLFSGLAVAATIYPALVLSLPLGRKEVLPLIGAVRGAFELRRQPVIAVEEVGVN